jgi:hypothetical protein
LLESLKCTSKRLSEILRVLRGAELVELKDEEIIKTSDCDIFVKFWDDGNINGMNEILSRYKPYELFLKFVMNERRIEIPVRNLDEERGKLTARLSETAGFKLTYVAFQTFRYWAMILGQVYISCFEKPAVYWGGEKTSFNDFKMAVKNAWEQAQGVDGYSHLAIVAEKTCTTLNISFTRFEQLFFEMLKNCLDEVYVSGSALRPIKRRGQVLMLRPRREVIILSPTVYGDKPWITKRYVEDGVLVEGRYMRFIRWVKADE